MKKFIKSVAMTIMACAATAVSMNTLAVEKKNFCPMPEVAPSEQALDAMFLEAMFEAEYVFRGKLFTYYNEKCDDEICAYNGLVFKVLEDVENETPAYVEVEWQEDCERLWLYPTDWRENKEQMFFEIKKEYLLIAKDTPRGMVITGARKGLKIKELKMKFDFERIGRYK